MEALKSGKYDPDKTALLITQTGGGCRASNYIHLLRKCMAQQFPQVPVISLNFAGLEKASGFQLTLPLCIKLVYGVLYADLLMTIYNQCRPYELNEGESQKTLEQWQNKLDKLFRTNDYRHTKKQPPRRFSVTRGLRTSRSNADVICSVLCSKLGK